MAHTEGHLRNLLNKIAEEQNYRNPEIILNDISSGGANYTSKLHTVIIRGEDKEDLHLFAKVGVIGEKFRNEVAVNIFDTEQFAYTKLWKIYAALEEEHGVPVEHRVPFTKFYACDPTEYQETLVLENLLTQGYGPCDRFKSVDWEYASAAITDCAKLHALSFAFRKKSPEEFEKTLKGLKLNWGEMNLEVMMESSIKSALKVIKPEHKEVFEKFVDRHIAEALVTLYSPIRTTVIIHGDFRGSNLLHRVREDGKVDIKIVDLQTLSGGSPVTDLIYFILTGTDEQFRAQYFDKLIDHYYTQLSASLRRLHLDPDEVYSREDFDYELKEKLPLGLNLATFNLPMITVDTEDAPQVDEDLEFSSFTVEKTSDLYRERMNGIVNDYIKWGILK